MKIAICWMLVVAVHAAEKKPAKPAPAPPATRKSVSEPMKKAESQADKIPAGATEVQAGIFKYTDPAGKHWVYRRTPWGIMQLEDKQASQAAAPPSENSPEVESIKVIDLGDSLRFERPAPIGVHHWEKKKTELNDMEAAAWKRASEKKEQE